MSDIVLGIFGGSGMTLFFKVITLICIVLFVIFTVFLLNYINSLRRIVVIKGLTGSNFIYLIAVAYVVASISLFFIALVIL